MAFTINHNAMALNSANALVRNFTSFSNSMRKLSTGLRVECAADDAAGLAIRELMRADIAALNQGVRNVNDAISLVQTADGAMDIIDAQLIRMKELSEQAATGTYNSVQRLMIDSEYQQLADEITRIADSTDFNGIKLLDGSLDRFAPVTLNGEAIAFINEEFEKTWYGETSGFSLFELNATTGFYELPSGRYNTLLDEASGDRYVKVAQAGKLNPRDYDYVEWQAHAANAMNVLNALVADGKQYEHVTHNDVANIPQADTLNAAVKFTGTVDVTQAEINNALRASAEANENNGLLIHFGPMNDSAEDYYFIDIGRVTAQALGLGNNSINNEGNNIQTQANAAEALVAVDAAIVSKDKIRAHLGAMQNRLEATAENLIVQSENLAAAESRISDVDVAQEMTGFVKKQILTQAGIAMLAQANAAPHMAMSLIGN